VSALARGKMRDPLEGFAKLPLLASLWLGQDAYRVAIFEELGRRTDRETSPGAVRVTVRRCGSRRSGSCSASWPAISSLRASPDLMRAPDRRAGGAR
jgi:hypothetical protein